MKCFTLKGNNDIFSSDFHSPSPEMHSKYIRNKKGSKILVLKSGMVSFLL
jgi:hypothetical protein